MDERLKQIKALLLEATRLIDEQNSVSAQITEEDLPDLKSLLCDSENIFWALQVDNSKLISVTFFRDGHLNNPRGRDIWSLAGRELTLKWPNINAPGGFWIDKLVASSDGLSFKGTNQRDLPIRLFSRLVRQPVDDSRPVDPTALGDLKSLLNSEDWPRATFSFQVTDENSELDKQDRAEGIANIILPSMKDKKFLDFGCGEGHLVRFVADEASVSVGYDISKPGTLPWESEFEGYLLTADLGKVAAKGPYDIVLLYDVLDHAEGEISEVLKKASEFLAADGLIIVRCHPWASRHGGHTYRSINKAFCHLVLTKNEMEELGESLPHSQRVLFALEAYERAIVAAGLKNHKKPEVDRQEVEPFFRHCQIVRSRLFGAFGMVDLGQDLPEDQMSICFVDYWLKKA